METYADARVAAAPRVRESRTRGALTVSDWLSGSVRYALSAGLDSWNGDRKTASLGGSIERRLLRDRVSVSIDGSRWVPIGEGRGFNAVGARLRARSSADTRGWVYLGSIGTERVSEAAPLALWPGAGDGHARAPLLRAHPLLDDGIISLDGSSAFGRTLAYGGVEAQRWFERPSLVRMGVGGFVDVARASGAPRPAASRRSSMSGRDCASKSPGPPGCCASTSRAVFATARPR